MIPQIQGLRAIAVLLVVVYHFWPGRLTGGYVGVDVFFVISGFLITGNLLRELRSTGRVGLMRFYFRRARRLLPAAGLVLVATAVGVLLLEPVRTWPSLGAQIAASGLYVQNWLLAADSVDYLAQQSALVSPVQHFWSLSIEEQFYAVWPLLLIAATLVATRTGRDRDAVLVIGMSAVLVMSFIASALLTVSDPGPAYFWTHTRAWEFALGGLLALAAIRGLALPRPFREPALLVGVAMIGVSAVLFDSSTSFPGVAAAIPVVGTGLALAAVTARDVGPGEGPIGRLLGWAPAVWVGDRSYSLYLWHWPVLVLAPLALDRGLTLVDELVVLILVVVVSAATTRWVETPFRALPSGSRVGRSLVLVTAACIVPALVISGAGAATAESRIAADLAEQARVIEDAPPCFGAQALIRPGCESVDVDPAALVPSIDAAVRDDVNTPECWSRSGEATMRVCSHGSEGAPHRVALVGDSHSNQFLSAMMQLAAGGEYRVDVFGKAGCLWTSVEQVDTPRWVNDCEEWKSSVRRALDEGAYDAVVTSGYSSSPVVGDAVEGLVREWTSALESVPAIIALRDTPRMPTDYLACIEESRSSCGPDRDAALEPDPQVDAAGRVDGVRLLDLTDAICDESVCSPVVGGVIVYRDPTHLTSTYARTLAPLIERELALVIG